MIHATMTKDETFDGVDQRILETIIIKSGKTQMDNWTHSMF